MEPDLRREALLRLLEDQDVARPLELAKKLNVSSETIRRDLIWLEQDGTVHRVHGGVALARVSRREASRAERAGREETAKDEIGTLLADLIDASAAIALDVGTTVEACARRLRSEFTGRVVTNSFPVATALNGSAAEVHFLGGDLRLDELTTSGSETVEQMRRFHVDVAVIGCSAIDPDHGPTYLDLDSFGVRRAMIEAAEQTYVVADASKFGEVAFKSVCDWSRITAVITDSSVPQQIVEDFRGQGVRLLRAEPSSATRSA